MVGSGRRTVKTPRAGRMMRAMRMEKRRRGRVVGEPQDRRREQGILLLGVSNSEIHHPGRVISLAHTCISVQQIPAKER